MHTSKSNLHLYQALTLMMMVLLVAAGGGLSIVWLRHEIADAARRIQKYEEELSEAKRHIQHLDTKIAEVHQPEYLKRRVKQLGLRLARPRSRQIVRLEETSQNLEADRKGSRQRPGTHELALAGFSASEPSE